MHERQKHVLQSHGPPSYTVQQSHAVQQSHVLTAALLPTSAQQPAAERPLTDPATGEKKVPPIRISTKARGGTGPNHLVDRTVGVILPTRQVRCVSFAAPGRG